MNTSPQQPTNPVTESERSRQLRHHYEGRNIWEFTYPVAFQHYRGYDIYFDDHCFVGITDNYDGPGDHVNCVTGSDVSYIVDQIDEILNEQLIEA